MAGIFETDFYEVDDTWAYAPILAVQKLLSVGDVVNSIELRLDDLNLAPKVAREAVRVAGDRYVATPWRKQTEASSMPCNGARRNRDHDRHD